MMQSRAARILLAAIKRYVRHGHKTYAGSLTYTTLFALVPLLTVLYSVLSIVPALQDRSSDIQQLLIGNLMPASGDAIMGYLHQFSQQAKKLTVVGVIFLIITAFMMLRTIEMTFNQIWQLDRNRKGLASFLLYWAILSLGPFMLSSGLAFSSYVVSLELWREDWVPGFGLQLMVVLLPLLTSFFAFTLLYWAVPNCRIKLKHAAVGGAAVALAFEAGKLLFAEATTFFPSYQLIYGAFAAVPLFLLWLFVSWSLILFGAELVYQTGLEQVDDEEVLSEEESIKLQLRVLSVIYNKHQHGEACELQELVDVCQHNYHQMHQVVQALEDMKILTLKKGPEQDFIYLVRDLYHYTLADLFSHYREKSIRALQTDDLAGVETDRLKEVLSKHQQDFSLNFQQPLSQYLTLQSKNKVVDIHHHG
jgi:membrane protein